jgi:hypothetical protein
VIYQKSYDELLQICKQITLHRQKLAKPKVDDIVCRHIDITISNENLLSHQIGESLLRRIDRKLLDSKNIYVQQFDIPQIQLFYSMSESIPMVATGHSLANQYQMHVMENLKVASLFEIGIGKGRQVIQLLQMLKASPNRLERFNIIAVDPDEQNLTDTKAALSKEQKELPFTLHYYPVRNMIENFRDRDFDQVKKTGGKNILVNSAFSFHHTAHPVKDTETRTELFKNIAKLNPLIVTLVEPNSNHDTEDLPKRFHNSWQHFSHVFKLIDESKIDDTHKFSIKVKFFGREITDIFGVSDFFRSERHELYDSWLLRLSKAGFKPLQFDDLKVSLPDHIDFSVSEGLVRMKYDGATIVSVMVYSLEK